MTADLFQTANGSANGHQPVTVVARPRKFTAWLGPDAGTAEPAHAKPPLDRAGKWLRAAMAALAVLALAAAVVSYQAQYAMVLAYKGTRFIAAVQAAIPDVGALVFASLAIAMALRGKRAVRPRILNLTCVAISITMNALAASAGWTGLAVWIMAPVLYALASDTLVTVIRAWSIARQRELDGDLADDDGSPLGIIGAVVLWLLRLALAPRSTLGGFRAWVLEEVRVAPGRTIPKPPLPVPAVVSSEVPAADLPDAIEAPADDTSQKPPVSALKRVRRLGRKATDDDLLRAMLEIAADGTPVTKTRVVRELPVGDGRAARLMARWNDGHPFLPAVS